MPNFFDDAALAMLDPTSVQQQHRPSFHSFASWTDEDITALRFKEPTLVSAQLWADVERERTRSHSFAHVDTASPDLCGGDEDAFARFASFDAGAHGNMLGFFEGGLHTGADDDTLGPVTPSDALSPNPGCSFGSTSPSSTYSASRPAATTAQPYPLRLPATLTAATHGDDVFAYDAALFATPYHQQQQQHQGLSSKTSVESFASSAASDILRTPRQSWSHPWDELSMPSGHHAAQDGALPGESPVQPAYRRAGSPRRDRVLSAKHSMPALTEEDDAAPGMGMAISQGLNTLPSYHAQQQLQQQQDDIFFFAPPPMLQAMPLLPAAPVHEVHAGSYEAHTTAFQAQSAYELQAPQYQCAHPDEQAQLQTSLAPFGAGQDGRPLTAPDSNASSAGEVAPSSVSSGMRKTRSIDPRARKVSGQQPMADLFTFKEREIPSRLDGSPNGVSKSAHFSKGAHKREASELFATQPIDVSRGDLGRPLSIKVCPTKQPYSQAYLQAQAQGPAYYPASMHPITPDEHAFPVHPVHPSVLQPHSFPYGVTIDDNVVLPVAYYTPPRTGRTNSTDSMASWCNGDRAAFEPASTHYPAQWQQQLGGYPSLGVSQPMKQSMSLPVAGGTRSYSLCGWDVPPVSDVLVVPATANPAGISARPMAPLPSPRKRVASEKQPATPKTPRKASGKKAKAAEGFACSFINFTQDDAEKLLTGVAPSGSAKRRRDVSGSSDDGSGSPKRAKA